MVDFLILAFLLGLPAWLIWHYGRAEEQIKQYTHREYGPAFEQAVRRASEGLKHPPDSSS